MYDEAISFIKNNHNSQHHTMRSLIILLSLLILISCEPPAPEKPQATRGHLTERIIPKEKATSPIDAGMSAKLVVIIVIDQWSYNLFEQYQPYYQYGFKRLWEEGVVYTQALQDHAATYTGPGHSVIATGVYPNKTGIVGNEFYVHGLEREFYCVEDPSVDIINGGIKKNYAYGVSPIHLKAKTLGELLKQRYPASQSFSISGKDRSAVLMAGTDSDGVFWYDKKTGGFSSSTYYTKALPSFMKDFNQQQPINNYLNSEWLKSTQQLDYKKITREDSFIGEDEKLDFPHPLKPKNGKANSWFYDKFRDTPFFDEYTLLAAKQLIDSQHLGENQTPDLLTLSLSATDYIGHNWGPYSQEMFDNLIRLDKNLGEFMEYLEQRVGKDQLLMVFTSDHGVAPLPEHQTQKGKEAKRVTLLELTYSVKRVLDELQKEWQLDEPVVAFKSGTYPFYHKDLTEEQKDSVLARLKEIDFIEEVVDYTRLDKMQNASLRQDFSRINYRGHVADLGFVFKEGYLVNLTSGTTHGSVHWYDKHVPIVFMGKAFSAQKHPQAVSTVDIAPTLARLLNINYQDFDGRDLLQNNAE